MKFEAGMQVVYVPRHANNDANHPDCEVGVVFSVTDRFVFVQYGVNQQYKATLAEDLVVLG